MQKKLINATNQIIRHIEQTTEYSIIESWNGGKLPIRIITKYINNLPTLIISINSNRHNGYIAITLERTDLYTIRLYDILFNLIAEERDIFGETLGANIETIISNNGTTQSDN